MDSSTAGTASFFPVRNSYTSDTYIALISFSQTLEALPLLRKTTEGFFFFSPPIITPRDRAALDLPTG